MVAGAKEIAVSPIIVGSFPSKEASLVEVINFDFDYYLFKLGRPLQFTKKSIVLMM